MRALCPACPPGALPSMITVCKPSDAPYTAPASPAGPAADDAQVVEGLVGSGMEVEGGGELSRRRCAEGVAVGEEHQRQLGRGRRVRGLPQRLRLLVLIDIEPHVGNVVASEKRLDLVAAVGPSVADDPNAPFGIGMSAAPRGQEILEDRVQAVLGRVPRLQQVVMEAQVVDRLDREHRCPRTRSAARASPWVRRSAAWLKNVVPTMPGIRWSETIRAMGLSRSRS